MESVQDLDEDRIAQLLSPHVGDDLRAVRAVTPDGDAEHIYVRDDVASKYDEDEIEEIGRELILKLWERDYHEDLFDVGDVRYATYHFERATLVMLYLGEEQGMVISIDADATADADAVADTVVDALND